MQLAWYWHDPGQWAGQLGWSSLGRDVGKHGGQHITSSSSVDLDMKWGCSLTAGACRQLYHCLCFITPWGTDNIYHSLLWVSISYGSTIDHINEQLITWGSFLSVNLYHISFLLLSTASLAVGLLRSIGLNGLLASSSRIAALCMPVTFLEQTLQIAFCVGQLSWPGGCEWVQLGHYEANCCGLFLWDWQPWQRVWMALPAHTAAAPDPIA